MTAPSSTRLGHPFTFLQLPFPSSLIKIHKFVIPRPLHGYAAAIQIPELPKVEGRGEKKRGSPWLIHHPGAMGGRGVEKEGEAATHGCWATETLVLSEVPPGLSSSPVTGSSLVERTSCGDGLPGAAPRSASSAAPSAPGPAAAAPRPPPHGGAPGPALPGSPHAASRLPQQRPHHADH